MKAIEDNSSTPPTSGHSLLTLIAAEDVAAFSFVTLVTAGSLFSCGGNRFVMIGSS